MSLDIASAPKNLHEREKKWLSYQENECPICREKGNLFSDCQVKLMTADSENNRKICHLFHRTCIKNWNAQCERNQIDPYCPMCHRKIICIDPTPSQEIVCAAQNNDLNLDMVEKLFEMGVSEEACGKVAKIAAAKGSLDLVRTCLKKGIPRDAQSSAIEEAAQNGHLQIVKELLLNYELLDSELALAANAAARGGYTDIVTELFSSYYDPLTAKGYLVFSAFVSGQFEFAQHLMIEQHSAQAIRSIATGLAASEGRLEILRELLKGGEISGKARGMAIVLATSKGRLDIVRELLKKGQIPELYRGGGLIEAVRNQHIEIIRELLQHGTISEKCRESAIRIANECGYKEVLRIFSNPSVKKRSYGIIISLIGIVALSIFIKNWYIPKP